MTQIDPAVLTLLISTLCGTVATLATGILSYMREGRAHKWQQDLAAHEARERQEIAAEVKAHAAYAANVVAATTKAGVDTIVSKIDENTEVSVRAFDEANGVNKKILAIGELRRREQGNNTIEDVVAVSKDTNQTVHDIDEKINQVVKEGSTC